MSAFGEWTTAYGLPAFAYTMDQERESGRGYYRSVCFKLFVRVAGEWLDIGDGGDVDWTAKLLSDRRERLFISGVGSERVAALPGELTRG